MNSFKWIFSIAKDQNSIFCIAKCISERMKYESAILLSAVFHFGNEHHYCFQKPRMHTIPLTTLAKSLMKENDENDHY